jgi:hypothetical protein
MVVRGRRLVMDWVMASLGVAVAILVLAGLASYWLASRKAEQVPPDESDYPEIAPQ